jgi:HAD superfamily hydrolase (TIGR01484 family)
MHYLALATDYDGTLAHHGKVSRPTLKAVKRLKASGRKLILVTGRELEELRTIFPEVDEVFDRVVAENGALLYDPQTKRETLLAPKANPDLVAQLQKRRVTPLFVGQAIIATHEPHQIAALEAIQKLGLELQVLFNKGSVMILPSGINKETGLMAALKDLGLSAHNVVSVGDAENDHALLRCSGCAVAVSNALDSLKEGADWVTDAPHGEGVIELIEQVLEDDLLAIDRGSKRRQVVLGRNDEGKKVRCLLREASLLIAGPSGSGKTTVTTALLERIAKDDYQFCVIDPEGDYEHFPGTVYLGDPKHVPTTDEILQLLECFDNPVVNLLGLPLEDRPKYFAELIGKIQELRSRTGRPHLIVIDEAHHLLPTEWRLAPLTLPIDLRGTLQVTVHPDKIAPDALRKTSWVLAVGAEPGKTIGQFCRAVGEDAPKVGKEGGKKLHVTAWRRLEEEEKSFILKIDPGTVEHSRHRRKYAHGDLEEDSFYFRGPDSRLKLRAQNLMMFCQIGDGVDDETWTYHLKRGDYSAWISKALQDKELVSELKKVEKADLSPKRSRQAIREAIERAYTAAA